MSFQGPNRQNQNMQGVQARRPTNAQLSNNPNSFPNKFVTGGQLLSGSIYVPPGAKPAPGQQFAPKPQQQQQKTPPVQQQQNATQNQQNQPDIKPLMQLPAPASGPPQPVPTPLAAESQSQGTEDNKPAKLAWLKNKGKISKKERQKRRNERLSKILQPKNAVMILNELRTVSYNVQENNDGLARFTANIDIDGSILSGYGRNSAEAKNNAAENALKHIIKSRPTPQSDKVDGTDKMETEDEEESSSIPWQHVASLAMFKLLNAWGEDFPQVFACDHNSAGAAAQTAAGGAVAGPVGVMKPAKKMPDNAAALNPIMLLNQMMPTATYEAAELQGAPNSSIFRFMCNVNGKTFIGTGTTKKAAKKMAAYAVCHEVLGVRYTPDVYTPPIVA